MDKNLKAGLEIHEGGGYSVGTQEGYEAFMAVRNKSLRQARINDFMKQAGTDTSGKWMSVDNAEKFAELIVRRTLDVVEAHTEIFQSDEARAIFEHIKKSVKTDFGVEDLPVDNVDRILRTVRTRGTKK